MLLADLIAGSFHHNAQHRLGAALAQEDASITGQSLSNFGHLCLYSGMVQHGILIGDADIFEHLRINGDILGQFGKGKDMK